MAQSTAPVPAQITMSEAVCDLLRAGGTSHEVSDILGITVTYVASIARKHGIKLRNACQAIGCPRGANSGNHLCCHHRPGGKLSGGRG